MRNSFWLLTKERRNIDMHSGSKTRFMSAITLLALVLFCSAFIGTALTKKVSAETLNGFVNEDGYTYYYENGEKHKGWLTLEGKRYYFTKGAGIMCTGWLQNSKGDKRYFDKTTGVMTTGWVSYSSGKLRYFSKSNGIMATGWLKVGSNRYYLDKDTGYALTGFQKIGSYYRYFYSRSAALARGWLTNSSGERRYFQTDSSKTKDGAMSTGFTEVDGKTYYFKASNGKMITGWKTISGKQYYFDNDGIMATGQITIEGKRYTFSSQGVLLEDNDTPGTSDGEKTIRNYLLGALMPVGKALYVWGGGWNDSTRIGVSPTWVDWYNNQSSGYDYSYYDDLSVSSRAKGLDCSGFVGWATYQVMQNKSGVGSGYTVVSGEVGGYYASLGWGTTINQNYLSNNGYTLKAGDIGYNSGHVWIVIGQCRDKSVVIVHSTPNAGCQIAGTNTPDGGYNSEAAALAKKYMSKYPGTSKYEYHYSAGNYIPRYNYFRWNRSTLADPDGYMNMYADEILADLFR